MSSELAKNVASPKYSPLLARYLASLVERPLYTKAVTAGMSSRSLRAPSPALSSYLLPLTRSPTSLWVTLTLTGLDWNKSTP